MSSQPSSLDISGMGGRSTSESKRPVQGEGGAGPSSLVFFVLFEGNDDSARRYTSAIGQPKGAE